MQFEIPQNAVESCGWGTSTSVTLSQTNMPQSLQDRLFCIVGNGCIVESATLDVTVTAVLDHLAVGDQDYDGACLQALQRGALDHPRVCARLDRITSSLVPYCSSASGSIVRATPMCSASGVNGDVTASAGADESLVCDTGSDACDSPSQGDSDTGVPDIFADTNHTGEHSEAGDTGVSAVEVYDGPYWHFDVDPSVSFVAVTDTIQTTSLVSVAGFLLAGSDPNRFLHGGLTGSSISFNGITYSPVDAGFASPVVVDLFAGTIEVEASELKHLWWSGGELGTDGGVTYSLVPTSDAVGTFDAATLEWELDFDTVYPSVATVSVHLEGTYGSVTP